MTPKKRSGPFLDAYQLGFRLIFDVDVKILLSPSKFCRCQRVCESVRVHVHMRVHVDVRVHVGGYM